MRRRLDAGCRPVGSRGELRLVRSSDPHLSEQQLVDFVAEMGSRTVRRSAGRHVARCSTCSGLLDRLRAVDHQLVHEGGERRLAAIPRQHPRRSRGRTETAAARGLYPRWRQVIAPLLVAACTLLFVKGALQTYWPAELYEGAMAVAVAGVVSESSGSPHVPRYLPRSRPRSGGIEAAPIVVEASSSPAAFAPERICNKLNTGSGVTVAPVRRASGATVRRSSVAPRSRITSRQHPGAGRYDDRVSPPPRGL